MLTGLSDMYLHLCINCMEDKGAETRCPHCGSPEQPSTLSSVQLKPRTLLCHKYVVGKSLGRGGFGITYLGFDTILARKIAIKEYFPSSLATRNPTHSNVMPLGNTQKEFFANGLKLFIREARTIAKVGEDSNYIVKVYDYFEENDTAYMAMKFLKGQNLAEFVKDRGGTIPVAEALTLLFPIFDALKVLHSKNLYHLDISPQNIIITQQKQPVLIDFGSVRRTVGEESQCLDQVYKPGYSPYELYMSDPGEIGPWTDIYSCSAALYQMITGTLPPPAPDRMFNAKVEPPSKLLAKLPENISGKELDYALLRALAVRKEDRFQSIEEFENVLQQVIQGEVIQEPEHKPKPVPKLPKGLLMGLAIMAIVVSLSVAVYLLFPTPAPAPESTPATQAPTPAILIKIEGIIIKDEQGKIIKPQNATYYLKPREKVKIEVTTNRGVLDRNAIRYIPIKGKTGIDGTYVAPDKPGERDLITVEILDQNTETRMDYEVIKVEINGTD